MLAPVNRIIPFSAVDGPGNRTAVFLQGCNINCKYCHNPETRRLCQSCGKCVETCPAGALSLRDGRVVFDWRKCCGCDTCIHVCPHDASPRIRWMTPEDCLGEILKNVPFIRGVTVSGGECTLHPNFLRELGKLCRARGLGYLLDANGTYDFAADPAGLLDCIDGVMLDIKAWKPEEHLRVTDADNALIRKNLCFLAEKGKLEEVRTVIVPELYDCAGTVRETARALKPYLEKKQIRYKIIAYRPMGVREDYRHFRTPTQAELQALKTLAEAEGMDNIVLI